MTLQTSALRAAATPVSSASDGDHDPSRRFWSRWREFPVTIALAAAFTLATVISVVLQLSGLHVLRYVGVGVRPLLVEHRWWTPVTSLFFASHPFQFVFALVGLLVLVAASERLMGTARVLVAFFVTGTVGCAVGLAIQVTGNGGGEYWARGTLHLVTVTPFAAVCGTIAAASAFAGALWRRRIRVLTVLTTLVFVLYSGQPSDLYRLLAIVAGIVLGIVMGPRPAARKTGWMRSSDREIRLLMASAVGIQAVGPAVALVSGSRFGPLGPIALLFSSHRFSTGEIVERCHALQLTAQCARQLTAARIDGVGPVVLSLLPLLLLLVAAYALIYGSRFALWIAVAVNLTLAALVALYFGLFPVIGADARAPFLRYHEVVVELFISALLPLGIAVVLIVLRKHFPQLPSRRSVSRFLVTITTAFVVLVVAYVVLGFAVASTGFTRTVDVTDLLADAVERFVPVNFLGTRPADFLPTQGVGMVAYRGVGPVFWLVVILAALRPMLASGTLSSAQDAAHARELVMRGGDTLSFMTTWAGNSYWFDPDGSAGVAYRVVNGIALTTGGPIGSPHSMRETLLRFARFCDDRGWVPVFYSVPASLASIFAEVGWETLIVAEEATIDPRNWSTTGKRWQDVRTAINRAQRAGLRAEWTTYSDLSLAHTVQLTEISEEWVAEKDLPEMGFTLGGVAELHDPAVRLMLAVSESGRIEAVTSWLPIYRDGRLHGWTLDFMRRRGDAMAGVMEFLIAACAVRMQADGIEIMSLSGAPLAHSSSSADRPGSHLDPVLARMSAALEPVYGFQSLLRFKQKFQPSFDGLIMAYPDAVVLPRIGVALTRAYLPSLSVRGAAGLLRPRG